MSEVGSGFIRQSGGAPVDRRYVLRRGFNQVVTSLPAGAQDGDVIRYKALATATGALSDAWWGFVYDASDGYWYFSGGAPMMTYISGTVTPNTLANTWQDSVTPALTLPFAGDYDAFGSALMLNTPAAALSPSMGLILGHTGTPGLYGQITTTTVAWLGTVDTRIPVLGVAAANTALSQAMFTQNGTPANTTWSQRVLSAVPLRVR